MGETLSTSKQDSTEKRPGFFAPKIVQRMTKKDSRVESPTQMSFAKKPQQTQHPSHPQWPKQSQQSQQDPMQTFARRVVPGEEMSASKHVFKKTQELARQADLSMHKAAAKAQ